MCNRLSGKIALVTGATSGIGKGIALEFARQGARVIVNGRNREMAEAVVAEISEAGGEASLFLADISDQAAVKAMASFVGKTYGKLDVLVNNAGDAMRARQRDGRIGETDEEYWDHMYRVSLRGTGMCCKYLMPHLVRSGGASIINIASIMALRGIGWDVYTMVKGGIVSLTRSMAVGYAADGVRVNCICPGSVIVERTAAMWAKVPKEKNAMLRGSLTRQGTPQDIAYCAVYLASDEGEYVTGGIFNIDGGMYAKGTHRDRPGD